MNNLSTRPQNKNFGKHASNTNKAKALERKQQYELDPRRCKHCQEALPYRYVGVFCDHTCAASYNNLKRPPKTDAMKKKVSESVTRFYDINGRVSKSKENSTPKYSKVQFLSCTCCKNIFYIKGHMNLALVKNHHLTVCPKCKSVPFSKIISNSCKNCHTEFLTRYPKKYCPDCFPTITYYRSLCAFEFNVYDYPDEFDLNLLNKFGWYSPNGYKKRNKTPNLNGVSRDHLYSIHDGFVNRIDPTILAHPANCQILIHNGQHGNNKKKANSSIDLETLKQRIIEWNIKYG